MTYLSPMHTPVVAAAAMLLHMLVAFSSPICFVVVSYASLHIALPKPPITIYSLRRTPFRNIASAFQHRACLVFSRLVSTEGVWACVSAGVLFPDTIRTVLPHPPRFVALVMLATMAATY